MWGRIAEQWVNYKWTVLFDDMLSPLKDGGNYKQGPLFVRGRPLHSWKQKKCPNSSTGSVSNEEKECLTHRQSTNPHWGGDKRKETVQKRRERLIHNGLKQDRGAEKWALLFKAALALGQVWEMTTGVAVSHPLSPPLLKKIYKHCWESFRRLLSNLRGDT